MSYLDGVLALAGVGVGFGLTLINDLFREKRRYRKTKSALFEEISQIQFILKTNAIEFNKDSYQVGDKLLPFITMAYQSLKTDLALILDSRELFAVNLAYRQVEKLNEVSSITHHEDGLVLRVFKKDEVDLACSLIVIALAILK